MPLPKLLAGTSAAALLLVAMTCVMAPVSAQAEDRKIGVEEKRPTLVPEDKQGEQTEPYTIRVSELTQTNNHGEGSCARFPAGTVHRRVAGVADNDVLNVRSEPKASAKIVAKVDPVGEVWMFPDSARNKWIRVAVQKFPASGTGTVVIVTGWVNSQYVGR